MISKIAFALGSGLVVGLFVAAALGTLFLVYESRARRRARLKLGSDRVLPWDQVAEAAERGEGVLIFTFLRPEGRVWWLPEVPTIPVPVEEMLDDACVTDAPDAVLSGKDLRRLFPLVPVEWVPERRGPRTVSESERIKRDNYDVFRTVSKLMDSAPARQWPDFPIDQTTDLTEWPKSEKLALAGLIVSQWRMGDGFPTAECIIIDLMPYVALIESSEDIVTLIPQAGDVFLACNLACFAVSWLHVDDIEWAERLALLALQNDDQELQLRFARSALMVGISARTGMSSEKIPERIRVLLSQQSNTDHMSKRSLHYLYETSHQEYGNPSDFRDEDLLFPLAWAVKNWVLTSVFWGMPSVVLFPKIMAFPSRIVLHGCDDAQVDFGL